jgi:hypothetical protein
MTLQEDMEKLSAEWQNLKRALLEAVEPVLLPVVRWLNRKLTR